jgi:glycosyltransferase involved in cell wall biosynthesis
MFDTLAMGMHTDRHASQSLVSILIPAFNAQPWIADTIRSAIAQTWQRKEIIVVDDGSTDCTLEIARRFESDSIRVVTQERQGAAAARNAAFALSTGDYIQWLDADDLLAPDKIERQIEDAQSHGADGRVLLSSAWGWFLYRPHKARFEPTALWANLSPVDWLLIRMEHGVFMQTATWLVSRELTLAAGPWNTQLLSDDDGEYFCRVLLSSSAVRFVRQARVYYRKSGMSALSYIGQSNEKMDALFLSMQLHVAYVRSLEDSARVRAACVKYLQGWLVVLYPQRPDLVERAKELAATLNGCLRTPVLSWKYAWIQNLFGWPLAQSARTLLPQCKMSAMRIWDRTLSRFDIREV